MTRGRLLWAVGAAGVALGLAVAVLVMASDWIDHKPIVTVQLLVIGWSFLAAGLFAWRRRPGNRVGPLMVAVSAAWFVSGLMCSDVQLLFSIGYLASPIPYAIVVHLLLAYPTGRIRDPLARGVLIAAYAVAGLGSLVVSLLRVHDAAAKHSPDNLFAVVDAPGAADAIETAVTLLGAVIVLVAGGLLVRRWLRATALQRKGLAPVLLTGVLFLAFLAITLTVDQLSDSLAIEDGVGALAALLMLAVPYSYVAGVLGSGYSRAHAVGSLVERMNQAASRQSLRDAMSESLGDPSLELVFKRRGRDEWVDAEGRRCLAPCDRGVTEIVRDGEPIAAIVHRASLDDDPELMRSVGSAAALALENDRLHAELRARVAELQESRANIIAFGLAERRRLERDLHDGAQQRLVALSLQVNLARAKLDDDPATAASLLDSAREELRQALSELRELARGIHPAVLTDQGLKAAVSALADRSPVPVTVAPLPEERLPSHVEAVAYFVVAESLTNVVKYAHAHEASVSVARVNGHAIVEVRDDGVGGADLGHGTGLRGLADRVAALDGKLEIVSPTGEGTMVRAAIPCVSS
jgi:signal transduction histidine kinase